MQSVYHLSVFNLGIVLLCVAEIGSAWYLHLEHPTDYGKMCFYRVSRTVDRSLAIGSVLFATSIEFILHKKVY